MLERQASDAVGEVSGVVVLGVVVVEGVTETTATGSGFALLKARVVTRPSNIGIYLPPYLRR